MPAPTRTNSADGGGDRAIVADKCAGGTVFLWFSEALGWPLSRPEPGSGTDGSKQRSMRPVRSDDGRGRNLRDTKKCE
jgi:hypothetical protein